MNRNCQSPGASLSSIRTTGISLLLIFLLSSVCAQQFNLKNYSVETGLAQSQVYCIHQDLRGLLWIGTRGGGISVFDGLEFKNYSSADGLAGNFVRCFAEDPSGYILAGTDEGICFFDGEKFQLITGFFQHFAVNQMLKLKKSNSYLIAANNGLWEWKSGNAKPEQIQIPGTGYNAAVFCIFEDEKGRIWTGTDFGIFVKDKMKWSKITTKEGLGVNAIRNFYEDRNGRFWVATYGGGVAWTQTDSLYSDEPFIFSAIKKEAGLTGKIVVEIFQDRKGNLWFATVDDGAFRFDGNQFTHFGENEGLKTNHVRCFAEDFWGNNA